MSCDSFARAIFRILKILGPLPLDYEIHQGAGLPLHAHINGRLYPYSNVAGTLNLPNLLRAERRGVAQGARAQQLDERGREARDSARLPPSLTRGRGDADKVGATPLRSMETRSRRERVSVKPPAGERAARFGGPALLPAGIQHGLTKLARVAQLARLRPAVRVHPAGPAVRDRKADLRMDAPSVSSNGASETTTPGESFRLPDRLALLQERANPFLGVLARSHRATHLEDVRRATHRSIASTERRKLFFIVRNESGACSRPFSPSDSGFVELR